MPFTMVLTGKGMANWLPKSIMGDRDRSLELCVVAIRVLPPNPRVAFCWADIPWPYTDKLILLTSSG